jgi:hypothetical protein
MAVGSQRTHALLTRQPTEQVRKWRPGAMCWLACSHTAWQWSLSSGSCPLPAITNSVFWTWVHFFPHLCLSFLVYKVDWAVCLPAFTWSLGSKDGVSVNHWEQRGPPRTGYSGPALRGPRRGGYQGDRYLLAAWGDMKQSRPRAKTDRLSYRPERLREQLGWGMGTDSLPLTLSLPLPQYKKQWPYFTHLSI